MKPLLRGHFHQAMFFVTLGAGVPLLLRCKTSAEMISIAVYILCALTMFGVSALYHRIYWSVEHRLIWKKLDHAGIFLMIAGTFTPVATLALEENLKIKLLITIWAVAAVGVLQSVFFVNVPKYVSSAIYLIAGYLILPYLSEIKASIGMTNVWLIAAGGISYSIGAICYALKRPVFNPKYFGYHEFFHLFVNLGAALHFLMINSMIK